jgi:hypothetical protein
MKRRKWDAAMDVLRVAKIYACYSYDSFLTQETKSGGRLRDVGSHTLDPVHNSGP